MGKCGTNGPGIAHERCHRRRRPVPRSWGAGWFPSPARRDPRVDIAGAPARSRPRMRPGSTRSGSQGRGASSAPSHAGAEDVGLVAPGAQDRAVTIGADVEMPGVMLARHRATDGTLPAVTRASTLRAHQRLRLCHRRITPSGSRDRRQATSSSTRTRRLRQFSCCAPRRCPARTRARRPRRSPPRGR